MSGNTPNPSNGTPSDTQSAKLGEDWKDEPYDQLASMMAQAQQQNESYTVKAIPYLQKASLLLNMTKNALSNAQEIVSKKSALGSDGLGDLFSQAKNILNASGAVLSSVANDKDPNSDQLDGAMMAALEAWNIVNFLYTQANSSCAEGVINGTVKDNFTKSKGITDLATANTAILWSNLFYTNIYHAYIQQSFSSGGPDFAKQAYNLSVAQTTFGLVKDLVDASTLIFSENQAKDPNDMLLEFLMNSINPSETLEYEQLHDAITKA